MPSEKVSPGQEKQEDSAGGITTVTGAGTDTVAAVMGSLGQVRRAWGSQDQSEQTVLVEEKDAGEGRGGRSSGREAREGPLPLHLMQYE